MISGMGRRAYLLTLMAVIALGAYLRLDDLGGPSLWHDEIIHLQTAESLAQQPWYRHLTGIREVVLARTENGFVYYWLQILGQRLAPGETGARLFPAIIGISTIPFMALCGRLVGGRLLGLLSAFLLAVSPLHVYFSREGRPYSLFMLLALVLLFALLQKGSRVGIGMAYGGSLTAACVGIQSVPMLLAFLSLSTVGLAWGLRERQSVFRSPYGHYLIAVILALGMVYGLYMSRSPVNRVGIEGLPSQSNQLNSPVHLSPISRIGLERFLASMTTSGHQSRLMEPRSWALVGMSLVGLFAGVFRRPRETIAIAGMFGLTAALTIVALASVNRGYGLRYTSPALPAFLLLVALGIATLSKLPGRLVTRGNQQVAGKLVTWTTAAVLALLLGSPNVSAARSEPYYKLDWRGVARFFDAVALEGEPILIPNSWSEICLGHYLQTLDRSVEFVNLWESSALGEREVATRPKGWMLTAGYRRTNEVRAWMHQFVPVLKKSEEEMALFFFPDFVTLLETRFAAQKGAVFEAQFEKAGQRFEFGGGEQALQGQGWSYPERNTAGIDYQWALGERAELGLPIGRPRDARIRLRVLPYTYPEAPPQTLEMRLNEEPLVTLELTQGWSEHEIAVPASSWSSGANVLDLRLARSTIPAQQGTGSTDQRNLSAAFDFLEVVTEDTAPTLP